jgi:hypothetical protein
MRWLGIAVVLLLSACESYPFSPYNLARAGCVWHHGNDPRCEYPNHLADGSWQAPAIPASDYTPFLHDNCPGQFPCGGGAMPVYEPDYGAMRAPQLPASDLEPVHLPIDPSGQFDGRRANGCPGISLAGTNNCLIPVGPDGR